MSSEIIANHNAVRHYKEKLNMLLEVVQIINEDHSTEELMAEFDTLLRDGLGVQKIIVYNRTRSHWDILLASGVSQEQLAMIDVARDFANITKIEGLTMAENPAFEGLDVVIPLFHKFKLAGYVLVGDGEDEDGLSPTYKNQKLIQILSNLVVVFIEHKRVQEKLSKEESLKNELKIASQIQMGLIPTNEELNVSSHCKVQSIYHPHHNVGGDYYDIINLSSYSFGFCMADVSGKGIGAALLMSNFQAMLRSLFTSHIPLDKLVRELNERICHSTSSTDKFITAFIGRYNIINGRLEYINAGHLAPIVNFQSDNSIVELQDGCIALGMLDFIPVIELGSISLRKGCKMVAFTDGLVELDDGAVVNRSVEEIKKILCKTEHIDQTMSSIAEMIDDNIARNRVFDDVSVLGIEFVKKGILRLR